MYKSYRTVIIASACILSGILITFNTQAQSDSKWYMGAMVGPSATNVLGDFPGNNYKIGMSGGVSLGRSFGDNDNFKVQADFLFSLKGTNQTYEEVSSINQDVVTSETKTKFDNNLNIGYLEVPLTARYSIPLGGGTFPYESRQGSTNLTFFAGPYFSYLLGAGAEFNTTQTSVVQFKDAQGEVTQEEETTREVDGGKFRVEGRDNFGTSPGLGAAEEIRQQLEPFAGNLPFDVDELISNNQPQSYSDGMNSIDLGVTAGIGLSFDIGDNNRLGIEGRFSQGMVSIDGDTPGAFSTSEVTFGNSQGGVPVPNVEYEQASLQNVQYAGYITWTYRFKDRTF